jgi:hypothetical protein
MSRKYRHVAWYSCFVAAYLVVLYLQVSHRQRKEARIGGRGMPVNELIWGPSHSQKHNPMLTVDICYSQANVHKAQGVVAA